MEILKATIHVKDSDLDQVNTLYFDQGQETGKVVQLFLDCPSSVSSEIIIITVLSGNWMIGLPGDGINTSQVRLADIRIDLPINPATRLRIVYKPTKLITPENVGIDLYAVVHPNKKEEDLYITKKAFFEWLTERAFR